MAKFSSIMNIIVGIIGVTALFIAISVYGSKSPSVGLVNVTKDSGEQIQDGNVVKNFLNTTDGADVIKKFLTEHPPDTFMTTDKFYKAKATSNPYLKDGGIGSDSRELSYVINGFPWMNLRNQAQPPDINTSTSWNVSLGSNTWGGYRAKDKYKTNKDKYDMRIQFVNK